MKIYIVSRQEDPNPDQLEVIHRVHGEDVEVSIVQLQSAAMTALVEFLRCHSGSFVYVTNGVAQAVCAVAQGFHFGIFDIDFSRRTPRGFMINGAYHVKDGRIQKVWGSCDSSPP